MSWAEAKWIRDGLSMQLTEETALPSDAVMETVIETEVESGKSNTSAVIASFTAQVTGRIRAMAEIKASYSSQVAGFIFILGENTPVNNTGQNPVIEGTEIAVVWGTGYISVSFDVDVVAGKTYYVHMMSNSSYASYCRKLELGWEKVGRPLTLRYLSGSVVSPGKEVIKECLGCPVWVNWSSYQQPWLVKKLEFGRTYPVKGSVRIAVTAARAASSDATYTAVIFRDSSGKNLAVLKSWDTADKVKEVDILIPEDGVVYVYGGSDYDGFYCQLWVKSMVLKGKEQFAVGNGPLGLL